MINLVRNQIYIYIKTKIKTIIKTEDTARNKETTHKNDKINQTIQVEKTIKQNNSQ